ncbi:phosphohydrolase [Aquincola sp. S2]|uniref:Phosphohydrolase n=1 Tax=Pseudaquabacterium terrae TaxID=2732868 RepID=A0ABX2ESZ5_9BURK|nr:phosphohydrolase [Aquabacterium terrae]NRF71824.1 phosphohydrolase [Aquabacterium terrae]
MRIVPLPPGLLHAGRPVPCTVRDARGAVLLRRAAPWPAEGLRGLPQACGLWVEADEAERLRAPAANECAAFDQRAGLRDADASYWPALQARADRLLRAPRTPGFLDELEALRHELSERLRRQPDKTLFALVHLASTSVEQYSATHALLCAASAMLIARQLPGWSEAQQRSLTLAALTMNVWMTALQDELAQQSEAPTPAQRAVVEGHSRGAAKLLAEIGVTDPAWLEAVAHHHDATAGPLGQRSTGLQLARVLQRVDLFTARLSPRRSRRAMSAAAAAQAAYLAEDGQPDEAGMLLIRALGLYPPGCRVRLASGELGIVLRRGARANTPAVAAVADAAGRPLATPALRQAAVQPDHAVKAALAPHDAALQLPFDRLLALVAA